jgi:2-polyprenyl-6-methoxyphenol hydroxylase-like FAD-dependent oxidoreductase
MLRVSRIDVLVAGAGPTGLTLACELARRGVSFRIVDVADRPSTGSRGKGLQPRTLEVFDDLGVVDEVVAAGGPYPRIRAHLGPLGLPAWSMARERARSSSTPYPNLWMLPQDRTEQILRRRLESLGGVAEFGVALTSFRQDADTVTATLARAGGAEEQVEARFLVGCDGGRSAVRRSLGLQFEGETLESQPLVVADVEVDAVDRHHWHVWPLAKGGVLGLCPLPGSDRHQLTASLSRHAPAPPLSEDGLGDLVARATGNRVHVTRATWMSLYRPHVRMVDRYRTGRVFVAGDAAHVHPPAGGQGLNTGVQDAYNLGWKLARVLAGAPDALLDTYEEERLPIAAAVLGLSKRLHCKPATRRGKETQQLSLHYRESTLSRDARDVPGRLRAGDRAPDALCTDRDGAPARLFDRFRGPHFTLLAFGGAPAAESEGIRLVRVVDDRAAAGPDDVVDSHGHARESYGMPSAGITLVRPDGYVGLFGQPPDVAPYLEMVGSANTRYPALSMCTR